jgi:hypothetical protein
LGHFLLAIGYSSASVFISVHGAPRAIHLWLTTQDAEWQTADAVRSQDHVLPVSCRRSRGPVRIDPHRRAESRQPGGLKTFRFWLPIIVPFFVDDDHDEDEDRLSAVLGCWTVSGD